MIKLRHIGESGSWPSLPSFHWMTYLSLLLMTSPGHAHRYRIVACRDVASNAKKLFGSMSGVECTGQGNESELIQTVKMETRHPLEGSFGNEFSSIYNNCRFMAAWSHKTWKKLPFLRFFLERRPFTGKFSKFCSESFHRNTNRDVVFKFCEILDNRNKNRGNW